MRCWARYVSLCRIYLICYKSSHRFLLIFFLVIEDTVSIEIMKKKYGSSCSSKSKQAFISLSSLEKSLMLCMYTRSFARANDAKIVPSRDAQCNTVESPYKNYHLTRARKRKQVRFSNQRG